MENKNQSTFMAAFTPAILIAVILIVFSLLMYLLDFEYDSSVNYISYVFLAVGLWWAITSYRNKQEGGFISYGKAFSMGFFVGLIASVLVSVYFYIYVQYINPGLIEEILLNAEDEMLTANPDMSDEQIDQALGMVEMFTSPLMMTVMGFIMNLIASTVLSLIIAIFAKREKTEEISAE